MRLGVPGQFIPGTPIDKIKQKSSIKGDLRQSVKHWSMSESSCFRSLRISIWDLQNLWRLILMTSDQE